jgi:hypothetical protein
MIMGDTWHFTMYYIVSIVWRQVFAKLHQMLHVFFFNKKDFVLDYCA